MLTNPKKGNLLIAKPSIIGDVSFNRAIVLLADHTEEGSVGFILNKPLTHSVKDLVPSISSKHIVYNGGPVQQDSLYYIHNVPNLIPDSIEISKGVFWGGNFEVVSKLLDDKLINEDNIRFFLGYSGWDSSQLEDELKSDSWVLLDNDYKDGLLGKEHESFWKEKMLELGGEYSIWSNAPEHPSYN